MNRIALTVPAAFMLILAACNTQPEAASGSSDDSVAATDPDTGDGEEVVSEGPNADATPYAGTTSGNDGVVGGVSRRDAGSASGSSNATTASSGAGTMSKGSATAADPRPPRDSKLQKADPR